MQLLTSASPAGQYTTAQLLAALTAGVAAISPRFEVLDASLARLGDLTTVTSAVVTVDADRAVKGSLDLTLRPTEPLLPFSTVAFTRYIKPWFRIVMPDGGFAEWPQGLFLWNRPKRTVEGTGSEDWKLTLGDRGSILLFGGPGPNGYTVAAGVKNTDAIIQTLQTVFGNNIDTTGVVASASTVASALTWDLAADLATATAPVAAPPVKKPTFKDKNSGAARSAGTTTKTNTAGSSGQPGTTWADILQALGSAIGYYSIFWNGIGSPISKPMPNLATATADVSYTDGAASILTAPATVDDNLDALANRVIVRSKNASVNAPYGIATADLNTLIPTHPYAQANIGFYIDAVIDDTVAGSLLDLQARAQMELFTRAAMYQSVEIACQAWPVHETFDVVGVQWTGDVDFGSLRTLHERKWTLDMFTGLSKRTLRRIVP